MQRVTISLAALLFGATVLFTSSLSAQDAATNFETYVLKAGGTVQAQVLSVEGDRVSMVARKGGTQSQVTLPLDRFTGISQFNIRRSVLADDYQAHLKLAEWTIEEGLFKQTRQALTTAAELAREAELGDEAAQGLGTRFLEIIESAFKAMVQKGKVMDARAGLRTLLLRRDGKISPEWRARLHDAVEGEAKARKEAQAKAKKKAAADKEEEKKDAAKKKDFARFEEHLQKGQDLRRQALVEARTQGQQRKLYDQAVRHFEAAGEEVEKLRKAYANDKDTLREIDGYVREGRIWWRDAMLSSASIDVQRGDFNAANRKVNRVLAYIPGDSQALGMRARIEIAANDWGRWR
jgi:hypothetical protein